MKSCTPDGDSFVKPREMKMKKEWVKTHLLDTNHQMPFSFLYDGKPSSELLKHWQKDIRINSLDSNRTQYAITWTESNSGLEVKCVSVEYADFPALEWTVYLKNNGNSDTPVLKEIQGIDSNFHTEKAGAYILHHSRGDLNRKESYAPLADTLSQGDSLRFAPPGGRPTFNAFPYFNLQTPDGGVFVAIGWPGQWAATFAVDEASGIHLIAGQERTNTYLKPGETVRTPLVAQLFWSGTDVERSHNMWRRWMLKHNLPRPGGKPLKPQIQACSSHQFNEMVDADEQSQKAFIEGYLNKGIKLDYWWMDAGWYPCKGSWLNTGTWEPDTTRFPLGLRPVSDFAHDRDVKTIVWFEPERVGDINSWLGKNHPEWLLGGKILNLGDPEVVEWAVDHFSGLITGQGVDLYRQDFNIDPLEYWRENDLADRQGYTENAYVQGFLAYWDGLLSRHPGMLIDACAGGGRRNDLETMRRAVPLLRSDYIFEPAGQQGHTYGLASWIPFFGTGIAPDCFSVYHFRSCATLAPILCYDVRPESNGDFTLIADLVEQWRETSPDMLGDYYPLLPYCVSDDSWLAWQFNNTEEDRGIIQAFRREKNDETSMVFRLKGLNPSKQYLVSNPDLQREEVLSGKTLMKEGLRVCIPGNPGSALIRYIVIK